MKSHGVFSSSTRRTFLAAALLAACAGTVRGATPTNDPALPKPVPAGRFDTLAAVSPFAPPSAAPVAAALTPPPPQPSWAEAWLLTSVAELGSGQYRLTLTKRKAGEGKGNDRVVVTTGQENAENIAIAGVQWSDKPEQTRITLNRSGVFAVFTFDPSATSPQGPGGGGAGIPGRIPGTPGAGFNVPPPPTFRPGMPTPAQTAPFMPGAEQALPPPPPPPAMMNNVPGRTADDMTPQRAGTRTAPIPAAPPATVVPQGRLYRPPGNNAANSPAAIRTLPGTVRADDEDDEPL